MTTAEATDLALDSRKSDADAAFLALQRLMGKAKRNDPSLDDSGAFRVACGAALGALQLGLAPFTRRGLQDALAACEEAGRLPKPVR